MLKPVNPNILAHHPPCFTGSEGVHLTRERHISKYCLFLCFSLSFFKKYGTIRSLFVLEGEIIIIIIRHLWNNNNVGVRAASHGHYSHDTQFFTVFIRGMTTAGETNRKMAKLCHIMLPVFRLCVPAHPLACGGPP